MALAPIWTQADVDTLARTIASGLLTVKYGGPPEREETYQSLAQMRSLLVAMRIELAGDDRPSFRLARSNKGFRPVNDGSSGGGFGDGNGGGF